MKELLPQINSWIESSAPFAIATVIRTWGSSPRPVGSTMIISASGEMAGSVSGGCVEGEVVKAALDIINSGATRLLDFGVTNDDAWSVGLSCGGKITVFVERFMAFDPRAEEVDVWASLNNALSENHSCILVTQLDGKATGHTFFTLDGSNLGQPASANLKEAVLNTLLKRQNSVFEEAGNQFFIQVFPRRSQMLIIGAAHITADLVEFAHTFDFETIVIDPRGAFANKTHFHTAPDLIIEKYPSEVIPDYILDTHTYAVILSHDPKIDDNALHLLLRSGVAYIGALGSKKTHAKRVDRLLEEGFSQEEISRIHAPIGLNIHAKTPREIALSIIAQIISVRNFEC